MTRKDKRNGLKGTPSKRRQKQQQKNQTDPDACPICEQPYHERLRIRLGETTWQSFYPGTPTDFVRAYARTCRSTSDRKNGGKLPKGQIYLYLHRPQGHV